MKQKKILVLYDGSNFYKKVKKILPGIHMTSYKYKNLAKFVAGKEPSEIIYCVGEIRNSGHDDKTRVLYAGQQALFESLRKQKLTIKLGYLMRTRDTFIEKGVDVQIAVDIVRGAIKNEYDICYLISSDSDLLPAIITAQSEDKKIVYVGFERFLSHALAATCSSTLILRQEHLLIFA